MLVISPAIWRILECEPTLNCSFWPLRKKDRLTLSLRFYAKVVLMLPTAVMRISVLSECYQLLMYNVMQDCASLLDGCTRSDKPIVLPIHLRLLLFIQLFNPSEAIAWLNQSIVPLKKCNSPPSITSCWCSPRKNIGCTSDVTQGTKDMITNVPMWVCLSSDVYLPQCHCLVNTSTQQTNNKVPCPKQWSKIVVQKCWFSWFHLHFQGRVMVAFIQSNLH